MHEFITLNAHYYQQFDADVTRPVPGETYGGWKHAPVQIAPEHTAMVVMHAWDTGTPQQYPGWWRAVEYMGRAQAILREVFPPLLAAVRRSPLKLYHVVGGGDYYSSYPGYQRASGLAPPSVAPSPMPSDAAVEALRTFRGKHVGVGEHNEPDVHRGFANLDFAPQARPHGDEAIAATADQLAALCRADGVSHLIYVGFAIDWCLLMSDGGMVDMSRRGALCSTVRQAVTAVENHQTAAAELCKQIGLWRVALAFGFVFDADELVRVLDAQVSAACGARSASSSADSRTLATASTVR